MKIATKPSPAQKLAIRATAAKRREKKIAKLERRYLAAAKRTDKASEACLHVSLNASHDKVQRALNRWADAAGKRDRLKKELDALRK